MTLNDNSNKINYAIKLYDSIPISLCNSTNNSTQNLYNITDPK